MNEKIAAILAKGGLVVMQSDTVYGIFASAINKSAVEKLRKVRKRKAEQGFIVLIDSVETVAKMVKLSDSTKKRLRAIWQTSNSPTSVILPAETLQETWLLDTTNGKPTICFRVPNDENLRQLLKQTGPLSSPSANPPGQPTARNITEAKNYFGQAVDLYVDGEEQIGNILPSRIIKFNKSGKLETVRSDGQNHAEDFVITRRRKLYKFARFDELSSCFQLDNWLNSREKSRLLKNYVKGNEVVMEIGAGSALFSVELARRSPDKTFLAVDIKSDRLYQGAKLAGKLNLKNIYFIRAEIARIGEIMPPHSVAEIWLTFPDPWPPKSDARRRLTAPRYLALYRKILASSELAVESEISTPKSPATANSTASSELAVKGGFVHFKTDNLPLFEWSLEQFMNNRWTAEFVGRDLHNSTASDQAKIMTSYEKRFMAEGLKINYAKFSLSQ